MKDKKTTIAAKVQKPKVKLSVLELIKKNNPSKHYSNNSLLNLLEPHELPVVNKGK